MPVRNSLQYLDEAVQSVLSQSFANFEFIILDDASTDGSSERLRYWAAKDKRIRLFEVDKRLGPVGSSNFVAAEARAPVVARMDADDICSPDRIAEQLRVLEQHPEAALVASLSNVIDARGRLLRGPERWRLPRKSPMAPFAHGAMMYRRKLFEEIGGYRRACEYWEDQDLITRMAAVGDILIIPNALYTVRLTTTSTRAASEQLHLEEALNHMYQVLTDTDRKDRRPEHLPRYSEKSGKVDPRVFVSLGSVPLWAGVKPRMFKRLLTRGKLRPDLATAAALAWAAWASINPFTLRAFLAAHAHIRNIIAGRVPIDVPVRWAPPVSTVSSGHRD